MTQDMMTLRALLEKSSDADCFAKSFTAERLMALEVEGLHGERSPDRMQRLRDRPGTGPAAS